MEGGTQTKGSEKTNKTWLLDGSWVMEGMTIEEAQQKADRLTQFASDELGLDRIEFTVGRGREREPVEFWHMGGDTPYRNMHARTDEESVAGTIASGARSHAHA